MPVLRRTALIAAPRRTVAGVLRDNAVITAALAEGGHRLRGPDRPLLAGDEVDVAARLLPGLALPIRTRVTAMDLDGMRSQRVSGLVRQLEHDVVLVEDTPGSTLLREELRWTSPLGPLGRLADALLVRRAVTALLAERVDAVSRRARALARGTVVVATAIVRDGRVLAARRSRPAALAGRWELPGGRVEAREDEAAAVVRECREELGTRVHPIGRIGTDVVIAPGLLRLHAARLAAGAPEPRALEHSELRWVGPGELDTLDWLDADLAFVADLRALLAPVHDREPRGTRHRGAPSKAP